MEGAGAGTNKEYEKLILISEEGRLRSPSCHHHHYISSFQIKIPLLSTNVKQDETLRMGNLTAE